MPSAYEEIKAKQDIPVISANKQGLITYINSAFEKAYGWTEKDLIGEPLATIIPKALHDAHNAGFSRFIHTETPSLLGKKLPLKIMTKAGTEIEAEHCIVAEKQSNDWVFAATIEKRS
jgi:PAS domain S-box-containing protein